MGLVLGGSLEQTALDAQAVRELPFSFYSVYAYHMPAWALGGGVPLMAACDGTYTLEEISRMPALGCDVLDLLDLIQPNGGASGLVENLKEADLLWGYSAWNTASNAMGTLPAQVVTDALRGQPNRFYYTERLLDDWLYQTVIRPQLAEMLEVEGENVFDLACKARAEEKLRALFEKELSSRGTQSSLPRYRVSLPWNRIFEAAITAEG